MAENPLIRSLSRLPRALVLLALLLGLASGARDPSLRDGKLIGYQEHGTAISRPPDIPKMWVEHISWEPRAVLYHNFLTPKECLYLIHKAGPQMAKSQVVDSSTGRSMSSNVRTSSGTFLGRGAGDIVRAIEERIAHVSHIPVDHGEPLHILHYELGQEYQAHYDYFHDTVNTRNGGQRIATMLMYLSDVEEGGETKFPAGTVGEKWPQGGWSKCAEGALSVRPRRGDALLFWSLKPDASVDPTSLHAGCPVIQGNKWSATKWMRVGVHVA